MKTKLLFAAALLAGRVAARAQSDPAAATKPTGPRRETGQFKRPRAAVSETDSERHAACRMSAPNAQIVQLDIGGHQYT